ncbi:MAG: YeeE/YedE family protein [Saprospiraceae bacterium]|nr:YeeE/YedE family protein [Saprospiraceae bacterium]
MTFLFEPWPWYVAGPLIGLIVPALLLLGNKHFGISANLRHICAACFPADVPFFQYNWKREAWNLFFIGGIAVGAFIAAFFMKNPEPIQIHPELAQDLAQYGVTHIDGMVPTDLFSWDSLLTLRGFVMMVVGGFLVGFGTRYAGGCTSGHAIMGLSNLQWPSLVATISFMIGGFLMTHLLLPFILAL